MTSRRRGAFSTALLGAAALAGVMAACGSDDPASVPQSVAGSAGASGIGGAGIGVGGSGVGVGGTGIAIDGGGISGNAGTGDPGGPYVLPEGFTKADFGGYKLGEPFNAGTPPANPGNGCGTTIAGV